MITILKMIIIINKNINNLFFKTHNQKMLEQFLNFDEIKIIQPFLVLISHVYFQIIKRLKFYTIWSSKVNMVREFLHPVSHPYK